MSLPALNQVEGSTPVQQDVILTCKALDEMPDDVLLKILSIVYNRRDVAHLKLVSRRFQLLNQNADVIASQTFLFQLRVSELAKWVGSM
jgi:hypothetical protein